MNWGQFEKELARLLEINFKVKTWLSADSPLDMMDSLAVVEVISLAEEWLCVEPTFEEIRACKFYHELKSMLEAKKDGN